MYKVFVGYFGINRSARWTAKSIEKNIVQPLRKSGFSVFKAAHFNAPEKINSEWSGEFGTSLKNDGFRLNLDIEKIEPQSLTSISDMLPHAINVPWFRRDDKDGQIRQNMLHQLHSLRRLNSILVDINEKFDLYLMLRADLEYLDRIDVESLMSIISSDIEMITPGWEKWGGMNDRFAFCNHRAAIIFMERWKYIENLCERYGYIHSETFLHHVMTENNVVFRETGLRAVRVRSTGKSSVEDFKISIPRLYWHKIRGRLRSNKISGLLRGSL